MTGIELLRMYAETMQTTTRCSQVPNVLGKECDDFESCYDCHRFVCEVIADQIERETLPRPLFEDGEPVRCGDMAMFGNKPREVVEYEVNDCGVAILHTHGDCWSLLHGQRLKRPSADTWERIEADARKFAVFYCDERGLLDLMCNTLEGDASTRHCTDCGCSCEEKMALDLVRRCKALAGVE